MKRRSISARPCKMQGRVGTADNLRDAHLLCIVEFHTVV